MIRTSRLALSLFLAFVVAGCIPEFIHTVAAPGAATPDDRLVAVWQGRDEDEVMFLHFANREDGGLDGIMVQYEEENGKPKGEWERMVIYTQNAGDNHFMSAREPAKDGKPTPRFLLLRYTVKDGVLTLWLAEEDVVEAAIKAGTLAGDLPKEKHGSATVSATTEQLGAFLAEANLDALFDSEDPVVLRRIEP